MLKKDGFMRTKRLTIIMMAILSLVSNSAAAELCTGTNSEVAGTETTNGASTTPATASCSGVVTCGSTETTPAFITGTLSSPTDKGFTPCYENPVIRPDYTISWQTIENDDLGHIYDAVLCGASLNKVCVIGISSGSSNAMLAAPVCVPGPESDAPVYAQGTCPVARTCGTLCCDVGQSCSNGRCIIPRQPELLVPAQPQVEEGFVILGVRETSILWMLLLIILAIVLLIILAILASLGKEKEKTQKIAIPHSKTLNTQ